ncbi:MAG: GFA family protein [Alphaproteobacteria bacterium]|nr:GFA family protein [Alphaproteobacteria bacterium]
MTKISLPLEGGCQCGKLRYRVSQPPLMIYCCHCTNCQKISGSAFAISATIVETSFEFTAGEAKKTEWQSDAGNQRYGYICGDCGTRIAHGSIPSIGMLSLRAGTLDDASWVEPVGHIWTKSAQPWVRFNEDDILCEGQPADYSPFVERFKAQGNFGD